MRLLFLATIVALSGGLAMPAPADEAGRRHVMKNAVEAQPHGSDACYCRAQGRTFAVGERACLRTPFGPRLAECGMVLNNTSWRFTESPCPES